MSNEKRPSGPIVKMKLTDGTIQEYVSGVFRIETKDEHGRPEECVFIPDDRIVEIGEKAEFMTAFVPWGVVKKKPVEGPVDEPG